MKLDENKNVIHELTEEERELIEEHKKFYADLFYYGNNILDDGFEETIEDYKLTIYSMLYRILELLDTLSVMTENSLINSGFLILRPLIEISVQLRYITMDKDKMQERATVLQMLDIKRTAVDENDFCNSMNNKECYKDCVHIIQDRKYNNWYSYCEREKITIKQLFDLTGWEELYKNLYSPLCIETHEINHMETNIDVVNSEYNKFSFKEFRIFENHVLLLSSVLTIMIYLFHNVVYMYGNKGLICEWELWEKRAINYIRGNNLLKNIEKKFNPLIKWFGEVDFKL